MDPIRNLKYSPDYASFLTYERIIFKLEILSKFQVNSVLDIGCGKAQALYCLINNGFNGSYMGIDNDGVLITEAKRNFSGNKYNFVEGTLASINLDDTFDLILLWGLLSFYDNPYPLLDKVIQRSNINGFISVFSGFSDSDYDINVSYSKASGTKEPGLNMFSISRIIDYLERKGCTVEKVKFVPTVRLERDFSNPLSSYTLDDDEHGRVIVNGLNIVRQFYHLLVRIG